MLMNNLDPEVAERPDDLVVYGGTGKAARSWSASTSSSRELRRSGTTRRCSCSRARPSAASGPTPTPRASSSPTRTSSAKWATWDEFRRLEELGLTMYGQMTAGSWIYIGTQGILQGTFETFVGAPARASAAAARGRAAGCSPAGLGGMGGAQPLAATMAGCRCLGVEVDPARIAKRLETRYVDERIDDISTPRWPGSPCKTPARPIAIGVLATPPRSTPSSCAAASRPTS